MSDEFSFLVYIIITLGHVGVLICCSGTSGAGTGAYVETKSLRRVEIGSSLVLSHCSSAVGLLEGMTGQGDIQRLVKCLS